jgi:phosphomevalonate kinase
MYPSTVAISAPGKVLFSGGFLVLDRQHTGTVFGLNARIHVHITPWETSSKNQNGRFLGRGILVQSPQFKDARWLYQSEKVADGSAVSVTQVVDLENYTPTGNKFVETTLRYVLTYLLHLSKEIEHSVIISILADDDYYSQQTGVAQQEAMTRSKFTNFGVKLSDAHKTGLGSSAALTTALVSALLVYTAGETTDLPQKIIHNLAQAAHCAAQGKVGSGFDVAAAVFGSIVYRRFTPAILEHVGDASSPGFGERLHHCVEDLDVDHKWDVEIAHEAVKVPSSLLLLMCDVDCGSETPGMVRQVLQWRKDNPEEAGVLWAAIQQGADDLRQELHRLSEVEGIETASYQVLNDIILTIRSLVREMSAKSKVPVEPPVITELLDYCTSLDGVVGGMAPGAGGYDAVALLVENNEKAVKGLHSRLEGWKSNDDSGAVIGKVRLLGVKQESDGVRREDMSRYEGWV